MSRKSNNLRKRLRVEQEQAASAKAKADKASYYAHELVSNNRRELAQQRQDMLRNLGVNPDTFMPKLAAWRSPVSRVVPCHHTVIEFRAQTLGINRMIEEYHLKLYPHQTRETVIAGIIHEYIKAITPVMEADARKVLEATFTEAKP
jgi:hypothetical protein